MAPWGGFLERTGLELTYLSQLLRPFAAERGLCGSQPWMKEEASVNFLRRGSTGRSCGCTGLCIPPPGREGAELGGARPGQSPSPSGSSALSGSGSQPPAESSYLRTQRERELGRAGLRALTQPLPLTVSPIAGGAERVGRGIRIAILGSPGARARGAGMTASRRRGAPEPESGIAMLRNRSPAGGGGCQCPTVGDFQNPNPEDEAAGQDPDVGESRSPSPES